MGSRRDGDESAQTVVKVLYREVSGQSVHPFPLFPDISFELLTPPSVSFDQRHT